MNREIKYRVWDLNLFIWRDFVLPKQNGNPVEIGGYDWQNLEEQKDNLVFQQFIGLFDKNGAPIYEGDILNWESNSMSHRLGECKRIRTVEVMWDKKSAAFVVVKKLSNNLLSPVTVWKMDANDFNGKPFIKEVIGNVFENKELLQA